jgi:hypothetical protein
MPEIFPLMSARAAGALDNMVIASSSQAQAVRPRANRCNLPGHRAIWLANSTSFAHCVFIKAYSLHERPVQQVFSSVMN